MGGQAPGGGGGLRIIADKTLIISRIIDSGPHDICALSYEFVDKSPDLSSNPNAAHGSASIVGREAPEKARPGPPGSPSEAEWEPFLKGQQDD